MFEHLPNRSWRVRPVRREDIRAFFQVREVMELTALDLARPHLVRAELEEILAATPDAAARRYQDRGRPAAQVSRRKNRETATSRNSSTGTRGFTTIEGSSISSTTRRRWPRRSDSIGRFSKPCSTRTGPRARDALSEHLRCQLPTLEGMIARILSEAGGAGAADDATTNDNT